jgi:two-component system, OmpR family, response regulator BaeR
MKGHWLTVADFEAPTRARLVVVVEAAERTTSALVALLLGEAFIVSRVADVAAAMRAAKQYAPDAVLIDADLRAAETIDMCRALRRCGDVPILVLAGNAETARCIDAENCGADERLIEPYQPAELIARLRALIERMPALAPRPPWRIDHGARTVAIDWQVLDLTPTEFRLLETLLLSAGKTHSREALLAGLHQQQRDVCDRSVDVHVRNLRRKIAAALPGRECIVSVYGVGYRFEA